MTLVAAGLAVASSAAMAADAGNVEIVVENVRSSDGMVLVQLCTEAQFLAKCAIRGRAAAQHGRVTITLPHVPPGSYAAMAFHDRDGNGTLDRWLGIPREDLGFSRLLRLPLRPPRFRDTVFTHGEGDQTLTIRLSSYFG